MSNRTRILYRSLALLAGPALLLVLGCADSEIGKLYPVKGTVKYKGEPIGKARINFVPKGGTSTHGAFGEVENGSFSLTTMTPGDGALPGEYIVTVDTRQIDNAKVDALTQELAKKYGMGKMSIPPPELQGKLLKKAKNLIPGKYQRPETSDITETVKAQSNSFDLELKD